MSSEQAVSTAPMIGREQIDKVAAGIRWRGYAHPDQLWRDMRPDDQQWWRKETMKILADAGLMVAKAVSRG